MIPARAWLCMPALTMLATCARAAITCTASITSVSVTYDPTVSQSTIATGTYTINCQRNVASDPTTFAWKLEVNDGLRGNNTVQSAGGQRYNYETYRTAPYTNANKWGTGNAAFTGTMTLAGVGQPTTASGPFDVVIPGGQTIQPAGVYSDTLTGTLKQNTKGSPPTLASPTFALTVTTNNHCQIVTPPGMVNFTYAAFQTSAATASTTYGVRCTTGIPYTMAFDLSSATLLGLTYSLAIAPSASATGNGLTQTYTIDGTIAAGQAGTCATAVCGGFHTRTLTVSW